MANLFDNDDSLFGSADDLFGGGDAALKRLRSAIKAFVHQSDWSGTQPRDIVAAARLLQFLINKKLEPNSLAARSASALECAIEGVIYNVTGKHLPPEALFRD